MNDVLKGIIKRAKQLHEAGGKVSQTNYKYNVAWSKCLEQAAEEYNKKNPKEKTAASAKAKAGSKAQAAKPRPARSKTAAQKTARSAEKKAKTASKPRG